MEITQELLDSLQLSENFTAAELCASTIAEAEGINNLPTIQQLLNITVVTRMCLQPVRTRLKVAIPKYSGISSGFRCLALNERVGSLATSDHLDGNAIDFQVPGISNLQVAEWMRENLKFDQLILEKHGDGKAPNAGWIHVSYRSPETNRNQVLTYDGKQYKRGLHTYFSGGLAIYDESNDSNAAT